nr:immunoglobulin light chain junction region [Macaca mulatta]
CQKYITWPWTF